MARGRGIITGWRGTAAREESGGNEDDRARAGKHPARLASLDAKGAEICAPLPREGLVHGDATSTAPNTANPGRRGKAPRSFTKVVYPSTLSTTIRHMEPWVWVERERRTAKLVRACYDALLSTRGVPPADLIHALCRLTWITNGGGSEYTNTAAVVAPALSTLLGTELEATTPQALARELRRHGAPGAIADLAARPIGFTNYYAAFRNIALEWLRDHRSDVWAIVRTVAEAKDASTVRTAYAAIDDLLPLPRPGAGAGKPRNLLTPLLACLDVRGHAPIINGRKVWLVKKLRLASASVARQYDGLVGLLGQAGIGDAFDLDQADEDKIEAALRAAPARGKVTPFAGKRLAERHDEDVEYLRRIDTVDMRRVHNKMTNALRAICEAAGVVTEEGSVQTCLFDALIREYQGTERHLLIEVKTDDSAPLYRMAVGQLHDYRRLLADRAGIDLAVLFPEKPSEDARSFLHYVGVKVLWLSNEMSRVRGDVALGGEQ